MGWLESMSAMRKSSFPQTKYYGYQVQGINLEAEALHSFNPPPGTTLADPAGNINTALSHLETDAASLKLQRQQLPLPLPI